MRTIADYRQLNDALFHAGLRSGSQYEWEDDAEPAALLRDRSPAPTPQGVLSYVVGVRSLDGAGAQARGVTAQAPAAATANAAAASFSVTVTNSGAAPATVGRPRGAPAAAFASDIYRVSVTVEGAGWEADVQNALVAVKAGESARVPVFARRRPAAPASARVTVTIVSESDPTKRATTVTRSSLRSPALTTCDRTCA